MTTPVYFATNRALRNQSRVIFSDTGAVTNPQPYLYRVGRLSLRRVGHPWLDPDAAFEVVDRHLFPESRGGARRAPTPGSRAMFHEIAGALAAQPRDVIVLIHGFASDLDNAARRAAEIAAAYRAPDPNGSGALVEPIVIVFSWPSDGALLSARTTGEARRRWAYASDRDDARLAGHAIGRFLLQVGSVLSSLIGDIRAPRPPRLHLVAHSMGVWALRHGVQRLCDELEEDGLRIPRLFSDIFLMAGDINDDALQREGWLRPAFDLARAVHVYHAENDAPVWLSARLPNQDRRLGRLGPADMAAVPALVSAIDCAAVSETPGDGGLPLRHQYYRLAPEVIADVRAVLADAPQSDIANRTPRGDRRWRLGYDADARARLKAGAAPA